MAIYFPLGKTKNAKFATKNDVGYWKRNLGRNNYFVFEDIIRRLKLYNGNNSLNTLYNKIDTTKSNQVGIINEIFHSIIPPEYFGNGHNRYQFMKICKKILTRSAHECIYISDLSDGFQCEFMQWLHYENNKEEKLRMANKWILERIVKPLIHQHYQTIIYGRVHELKFVKRHEWQRFKDKVTNQLISQGKLVQARHIVPEKHIRGVLMIIPKSSLDKLTYRPRLFSVNKSFKSECGIISKSIFAHARKILKFKNTNMFEAWTQFTKKTESKKIYAAKLDLEDAYGNVDIDFLLDYIEKCGDPLISPFVKRKIRDFLTNQYLRLFNKDSKKIYLWKKGVLQGYPLSASLCELYLCITDSVQNIIDTSAIYLVHRNVDDYLFCSTNKENVIKFINCLSSTRKINETKTQTNCIIGSNNQDSFTYCGRAFDLRTKEVRGLYDFANFSEVRHRFKFWNQKAPVKPALFLYRTMRYFINNFNFNKITLNLLYNRRRTFLENFYDAMVFLAIKFNEAYSLVSRRLEKKLILKILNKIIEQYSMRVYLQSKKYKTVGYQAFYNVLKKRNSLKKLVGTFPLKTRNLPYYFTRIPENFRKVFVRRSIKRSII